MSIFSTATVNYWRATLSDAISDSATIIGLVSTASLNPGQLRVPGVLVIDRRNAAGTDSPEKREYISFASLSGATLYAVTRGLTETAQSHSKNAVIEDVISINHWSSLLDFLNVSHGSDGSISPSSHVRSLTVTGVSGLSYIQGDVVFVPGSNISIHPLSGASGIPHLQIDSSVQPQLPPFFYSGTPSTASYVAPAIIIGKAVTIRSLAMAVSSIVSSASLVIDVNKNMTSIFTNQATRLSILGGGTFASTASIGTPSFSVGDILTLDIDNGSATATNLSVILET